jgi:hypothetical protein
MQYENTVVINIEELKSKHEKESLPYYIWSLALNCKKNSRAFWEMERSLRFKERLISIPLLVLSSASGVTSVTLQQSLSYVAANVMVAFGISSACLVAIQKLTRYAERAEKARNIAKAYARLARRIEGTMVFVESTLVQIEFIKFVRDIEKELDAILSDIDEVPHIPLEDDRKADNSDIRKEVHAMPMFREAVESS